MSLTTPNPWMVFAEKEAKINSRHFRSSDISPQVKRSGTTHSSPFALDKNPSSHESQTHNDDRSLPNPVASWRNFAEQHSDPPRQVIVDQVINSPSNVSVPISTSLRESAKFEVKKSEDDAQQERIYCRALGYIPSLPDPPLCFCGKISAQHTVPGIGIIYECSNADLRCDTRGSGATWKREICTFHIHKQPWDRFRQNLKDDKHVDYNDAELGGCPAFNYTFCVVFRIENKHTVKPLSSPNCFCNMATFCHQFTQQGHKRFVFKCSSSESDGTGPNDCGWLLRVEEAKVIQPPLLHQQLPAAPDGRPATDTIPSKPSFETRRLMYHPPRPQVVFPNNTVMERADEDTMRKYTLLESNNGNGVITSRPPSTGAIPMMHTRALDSSSSREDELIYANKPSQVRPIVFSQFSPSECHPKFNNFIKLLSDSKLPDSFEHLSLAPKDTRSALDNTDSLSSDSDHSSKSTHPTTTSHTAAVPACTFKLSVPTMVLSRRAADKKLKIDQLLQELEEEHRQLAEDELKLKETAGKLDLARTRLQELVEDRHLQERKDTGKDSLVLLERENADLRRQIDYVNSMLEQDVVDIERSERYKAIYLRANKTAAEYIRDLEERISTAEALTENLSMRHFKCRVCFQENIQAALVPCFHCSYCYNCADKLTECAICRVKKFDIQRIALS